MADMYGAVCSNAFRVKDSQAFKEFIKQFVFGDTPAGCETWEQDGQAYAGFGCYAQYPTTCPTRPVDDPDSDDEGEVDLDEFARQVAAHLVEGEVMNIVAGGYEKLRYVAFDQLVINWQGEWVARTVMSDDTGAARELLAQHGKRAIA